MYMKPFRDDGWWGPSALLMGPQSEVLHGGDVGGLTGDGGSVWVEKKGQKAKGFLT